MRKSSFSIDKLSALSKLSLTPIERQGLEQDILSILDFTKTLSDQNLEDYDDKYQSVTVENIFREDKVDSSALSLASLVKVDNIQDGYIKVGRVLK